MLTYYEFEGKAYSFDLLDLSHGFKSHESREEMIRRLGLVEEDTAYEFNDNTYQDIA